jgi:hypothetical protein
MTPPPAAGAQSPSTGDGDQPDLIRLTVNEIRRPLNTPLTALTHTLAHHLHWSQWRRRHPARARRAHYTRRLNLEFQP